MEHEDPESPEALLAMDAPERSAWLAQKEYGWDIARPAWTAEDGRRLQDKLRALLDYYGHTRGVGHTQLLLTGTLHTSRLESLILALTQQHADSLTHESTLPRGRGFSWGELPWALDSLRGVRRPLAVDHAVLQTILEECLREMARLEAQAANASEREQRAWSDGATETDRHWRRHIARGLTDNPRETVGEMMARWGEGP
jgi:hypothetical protein